jgi:hypothetical protein
VTERSRSPLTGTSIFSRNFSESGHRRRRAPVLAAPLPSGCSLRTLGAVTSVARVHRVEATQWNGGRGIRTPKGLRPPVFKLSTGLCAAFDQSLSRCCVCETRRDNLRRVRWFCERLRRNLPKNLPIDLGFLLGRARLGWGRRYQRAQMLLAQMGVAHGRSQIRMAERLLHVHRIRTAGEP